MKVTWGVRDGGRERGGVGAGRVAADEAADLRRRASGRRCWRRWPAPRAAQFGVQAAQRCAGKRRAAQGQGCRAGGRVAEGHSPLSAVTGPCRRSPCRPARAAAGGQPPAAEGPCTGPSGQRERSACCWVGAGVDREVLGWARERQSMGAVAEWVLSGAVYATKSGRMSWGGLRVPAACCGCVAAIRGGAAAPRRAPSGGDCEDAAARGRLLARAVPAPEQT